MQPAEIEEHSAVEQGLRIRFVHPRRELLLPLRDAQAPARIAGHDLALAQWKAAGSERFVHASREGREALSHSLGIAIRGIRKDDAVVLVGGQGLLVPALRPEREPAEWLPPRPTCHLLELDDTRGQQVVQRRHDPRELLGRNALRQKRTPQLPHRAGAHHQLLQGVGTPDRRAHRSQAHALQCEEVGLGDDSCGLSRLGDDEMVEAMARHRQRGFERHHRDRKADGVPRHDAVDGCVDTVFTQRDAVPEVAQREDARRRPVQSSHEYRSDAFALHRRQGGTHWGTHRAGHYWPPDHIPDRPVEWLTGHADSLIHMRGMAGESKQAGEPPRSVVLEGRTAAHQLRELGRWQPVAEGIPRGSVDAGNRTLPEEGAEREAFARGQSPARRLARRLVRADPQHCPLLDDVEVLGRRGRGREHGRIRREVHHAQASDEPIQGRLLHAVEGRMPAQILDRGRRNRRRDAQRGRFHVARVVARQRRRKAPGAPPLNDETTSARRPRNSKGPVNSTEPSTLGPGELSVRLF